MAEPRRFPDRVGRYQLLAPIATGGAATVYLASPAPALPDDPPLVALKLPHAPLGQVGGVSTAAELVEEAKLAARIRHANVVRIHDVGIDEQGFFLVMEYVEGDNLAKLLNTLAKSHERLPTAVARRILDDVLAGLEAAHSATDDAGRPLALVHRDVSPQNILVGLDGIARLADFGIARAATRAQFTQTGMVKGKAGYMSPEQAQGLALDQRSDVWSAGVVAWEMFAGRSLFPTDDPLATMLRIVNEPAPLVRSVQPDLPAALDDVLAAALAIEREARCPTTAALRAGIAAAFGDEPVAAHAEVGAAMQKACGERIESWRRETTTELERRRKRATAARRRVVVRRGLLGGGTTLAVLALLGAARRGWRATPATSGPQAITLATAQAFPRAVVVDERCAYWTTADGLYKTIKDGQLWFYPLAKLSDGRGLALDEGHVYYADFGAGRIGRVIKGELIPKDLPPAEELAQVEEPEAVALDATHVYFTSNVPGGVFRVAKTGGEAELVATPAACARPRRLIGLAVDATHAYWTDTGLQVVSRAPKGGGPVEWLANTGPEPYNIAIDEQRVYWRDGTNQGGRLLSVAKRGGPLRVLVADAGSFPRGVAVDESGVYWTAGHPKDGHVERVNRDGTGRTVLLTGQLGVHGITTDREAAYFTAWGGGSVWKVLKALPKAR